MRKGIFLFCNLDWGKVFFENFLNISVKYRKIIDSHSISFNIIFSTQQLSKKSKFRLKYIKWINELRFRNISILLIEDVNKFNFKQFDYTIGIITGFNQIFKKFTINQFNYLINFHPSILPLYRGPSPIYWNFKFNEDYIGYTAHLVTEKVDKGKILYQDIINVKKLGIKHYMKALELLSLKALPYFIDVINFFILETTLPPYTKQLDAFKIYKNHIDYIDRTGNITWVIKENM